MRWILLLLLISVVPAEAYEWTYLSMDGEYCTCIESDPIRRRIFVGTVEGFHYLDQASGEWTNRDWDGWIGRQVWSLQPHPAMENRIITGRENAFFKGYIEVSDDLGETEEIVYSSNGGGVTDIAEDGIRFYACTWPDVAPGEFLRSDDNGDHWTLLSGHGHYALTAIAFGWGGELYLAGDNLVMRSWDSGLTWEFVGGGLPTGELTRCITNSFDGGDVMPEMSHFAGTDTGLYFANTSNNWAEVLDIGCRDVEAYGGVWIIRSDEIAVVTMDGRVFASDSHGESWTDETGNLPDDAVDIAYSPYDKGLYVCTEESGVFYVPNVITSVSEASVAAGESALSAWPNPFNPRTTLSFDLAQAGHVDLSIYDVKGRRVAVLLDDHLAAGSREVSWNAENLAAGVYLASLKEERGFRALRLILLK